MEKFMFDVLVCPVHKTSLTRKNSEQTAAGVMKTGVLFCERCGAPVASVRHGKVDFLRIEPTLAFADIVTLCDDFYYKRLPWSDDSITAINCQSTHVGWNSEGFTGCLQAGLSPDWSIDIDTDATDLALRFLSHDWSGKVSVAVNDGASSIIDLYQANGNDIKAYEIFRNLPGKKRVTIGFAPINPESKGGQVYFFGMDAVFSGKTGSTVSNRGNGFPLAYKWVLENLGPDALVLDCGSGDRKFPDQRVVSFEYMPFELPDVFGDGHLLPFADSSFDAVFSQAVMEHMRDPYLAAREISRITKPGGLIYVESAFMQPLHAVPYHFFNTTSWGIEAIFGDADVNVEISEWFGPLSGSIEWYLNSCGGGGLTQIEREQLRQLFLKVDSNVSYDQLKPVASAVAFWGVKSGGGSYWKDLLVADDRPSFKYARSSIDATTKKSPTKSRPKKSLRSKAYGYLKSAAGRIVGK